MLHLYDGLPFYVPQPHVLLHLMRTIQAQSVRWLPLQAFIDEISCLHTPSFWYV
jgi:hypothetical protein